MDIKESKDTLRYQLIKYIENLYTLYNNGIISKNIFDTLLKDFKRIIKTIQEQVNFISFD